MRPAAGRLARRPFHLSYALVLMAAFVVGNATPAIAQAPWTWAGYFELVASPGGPPDAPIAADGVNRASRHPLSQDGRFVVFETDAPNLGAPAGASAIYRRDRISGVLTLVQAGFVRNAAISADGWHVAYEQCGFQFAPPCQIYSRHMGSLSTTLVSATSAGAAGNGDSFTPTLSSNGRYAVFVTTAPNLSGDSLRRKQIVWRDRDPDLDGIYDEPGVVIVQAITVIGALIGNGDSDTPEVSDDGRLIAFRSAASNLVGGDTNGVVDVFRRDRNLSTVQRLNVRPGNVQSPFPIAEPHISMSGNGQFVAFASADPVLTSSVADSNATLDVFLYQGTSTLLRVDVGRAGSSVVPGNGPTGWATLNADGRYVSLQSAATNAPFLSTTGTVQVYAVDRQFQTVTRISGMPDGTEPDAPSVQPSITGGGSLVLFSTSATTFTGAPVMPAFAQIHAAARLNVTPPDAHLQIWGSQSTVWVSAHSYTRLMPYTDPGGDWLHMSLTLNAPDNNMLTLSAPENTGPTRSTTVHIGTRTVTVTQDGNPIQLVAVSPAAGPMSGGTPVTIQGYGFTPDTVVSFGGIPVTTTFVDMGTLSVVTPAFPLRQPVTVRVSNPDQASSLDGAFTFLDDTPPVLSGIASGPQGLDGWFTGDITVTWTAADDQSALTATCAPALQTTDTAGTTFGCTATSEGGSTTASIVVKRDTTPPAITFASPYQRQLVEPGAPLNAEFSCTDPLSGVADCGLDLPSGTTLDTSAPGWHSVSTTATDTAGNVGTTTIEYAVASGVCVAPVDGLKHWLRFEDDLDDVMDWFNGQNGQMPAGLAFGSGVAGRAFSFAARTTGGLEIWPYQTIDNPAGFSAAMWIQPNGMATGALLERMSQIEMSRSILGPISVRVTAPDGAFETFESAGMAPFGVWTHIGLTFDAGTIRLYLNGRLDSTWTASFQTLHEPGRWGDVRIGNYFAPRDMWPFFGKLDEFQLFDRALSAAELEAIFLSGGTGICRPAPTTLTIPALTVTYGAGTFPATAILRDGSGQPLAGKRIRLDQLTVLGTVDFPTTFAVTDADGIVRWDAPFSVGVGTYPAGLRAFFAGDLDYSHTAWVLGPLTVTKAPTQLTWAAPAPIRYGTALTGAQLNATTSAAGTIAYSPGPGTVLSVGSRTLQATFTPTNANYATSTATVPIEVTTGLPTVSMVSATVTYNGLPQSLPASVRDYRGIALSPTALTYNGAAGAPVAAGVYDVVLSFPGNANYEPVTASATLTINKATPAIAFSTPATVTFDGQTHGLVATVTGVGGTTLGTAAVTYNGASDAPIDAGAYVVSATFDGNANYAARTVTTTLTITKATPTVTLAPQPASFTYDGQPHGVTATVTGVAGAALGSAPVTYNGVAAQPVDAGSYTASATFAGSTNYTARTQSATLTIAKATPAIVFAPQPTSFTYDGQPHPLTAAVVGVDGASLGTAPVAYSHSGTAPVAVGAYTVSATFGGNTNYTSHTATTPITITSATPLVTISGGPFVYDASGHGASVTVTGVGGQTVAATVTVTYDGSPVRPINAGTYTVVASVAASGNYAAASATGSLVIEPATPPIYWLAPNPITYGTPLDNRHLTAHSHVAGTWTYTPAAGTVLDVGPAQPLTVAFTPTDPNYVPATATRTIEVRQATPFVSVLAEFYTYDGQPHPAIHPRAFGAGLVTLAPLTVTYNGLPDPPVNAGTYTITATFDGDARHTPATGTATLTIHKASPGATWHPEVSIGYGTPLGPAHLNATAPIPGTFTYSPVAGTILDASAPQAHTIRATFTPDDSMNYAVQIVPAPIWVYRAMPMVRAFGGSFVYDGQPHAGSGTATGVGGVDLTPVTVTYNDSPEIPVAAGSYTVRAAFEGNTNYSPSSNATILTITRAPVTLTWNRPAAIRYGTPLGDAQLNATATVPGTWSYSPAAGTVLEPGAPSLWVTFTPTDSNHAGGTVGTPITVERALPTVSVTGGDVPYDGQPHPATASATGVGGLALTPVTLTYNGSSAAPVAAGTYAVVATFAGDSRHESGSATGTITIGKVAPTLSWAAPVALPYGPTLSATQLNAQASVPGTFSYSPGLSSRLPAGTHALTATFTPTDTTNYAAGGTVTTAITIVPAPLEIRTIDTAKAFGAPVPAFTASYTGLASGQTVAVLSGTLAFATTATANSPVGTYAVTPAGLSSPDYAITFVAGTLSVLKAPVALTLSASSTPSGLDMPITFTATVTAAQAAPTAPAGTVRFFDGATLLGTATLVNDSATLLTGGLAAGSHTIEARYEGDASFDFGTRTVSHVVATAAATPAIAITSSRQPSSTGLSVTLTATISVATAGTIAFYDGNTPLGTGSIAAGRATLTTSSLAVGSHAITARFLGNGSAPPVISPVFVQAVNGSGYKDRTSTLALMSSANPSTLGATVTFTATASGSSGTPTGRILFMVDGLVIGDPTGVAVTSGQASVSVSTLNGGRHKVTATYLGNSNYRGSNGALTQTMN